MAELDRPVIEHKTALIDEVIARYEIKSLVDLGGCWGVNGGYTFHALEHGGLERAVLVDGRLTDLTRERAAAWPQLELISGPLGDPETVEKVGRVDAAIMYDILLHQVNPDWDEFIRRYSHIDTLIIHNQNWLGPETIRFIDEFDVDEYVSRVYTMEEDRIRQWYAEHDEWCEEQDRPWRDVHNFWQWGITQKDFLRVLWDAGYRVDYMFSKGLFSKKWPETEIVDIIARRRELPHPFTPAPRAIGRPSPTPAAPAAPAAATPAAPATLAAASTAAAPPVPAAGAKAPVRLSFTARVRRRIRRTVRMAIKGR